ncbi:hypothetical protein RND81_06G129200 [Saponaria officinalis]|uniref:Uncharacterized protein n=1 Tax=Saponaria officinalis TaxID=3572 RepID=A0AAW1K669_SAPOF
MEVERQAVFTMVYSKREKLLRSSHEDLPRHMKQLELVFDYAKSKNVDVSEIQARVKTYLDFESQLDSLKREFQQKPSTLDTEEKLKSCHSEEGTPEKGARGAVQRRTSFRC